MGNITRLDNQIEGISKKLRTEKTLLDNTEQHLKQQKKKLINILKKKNDFKKEQSDYRSSTKS